MIMARDTVSNLKRREGVRLSQPVFDMAPFALPSAFWNPSHIRGSLWLEHLPFCFWAIEAGRPASVVVTGTSDGVPYFALCEALQRLRLEAQCLAILNGERPAAELVAYNEEHYGDFSMIEVADGVDATTLAPPSIDLLVLADHMPQEGRRLGEQWEAWLSKLSDRGVVLVPRIESAEPGASSAWERICKAYPHFTFHHGGGLGVVGVGKGLPELFRHLVNLEDGRHSGLVRAMFHRLGTAVAESNRHAAAKRALQRAEAHVLKLEDDLRLTVARQDVMRLELEKTAEQLKRAQTDLEAYGQRHAAEQRELEETVEKLKAVEAERKSAEQHHVAVRETLESELLVSSRKLQLQTEHAERVAAAIEALKKDHEANKARLFEARQAVVRAHAESKRNADRMQAELKRAEQRIRGIKGEMAGFRKKLHRERELHQLASAQLAAMLASRSWALTAPLRKIAEWVRK